MNKYDIERGVHRYAREEMNGFPNVLFSEQLEIVSLHGMLNTLRVHTDER